MEEFNFAQAFARIDGKVREEVKRVVDSLLEHCHTIDVMEQVLENAADIVRDLKEYSTPHEEKDD